MSRLSWEQMVLSPGNEDLLCELFHENSKIGRYSKGLSINEVWERMEQLGQSLQFSGYPAIKLPRRWVKMTKSLSQAILTRTSARHLKPSRLTLREIATILHFAYGITRQNQDSNFPRPFRVVPSGGALYPLEIFLHGRGIKGIPKGLYHFDPLKHQLRLIREGDQALNISKMTPYPELLSGSSLVIFLTAIFERSVFKYKDRGYRFVLLEAGHVAQNLNLVSNGLGLGSINIGGFFDREVDEFLGLDGITHSTIYITAIGKPAKNNNK